MSLKEFIKSKSIELENKDWKKRQKCLPLIDKQVGYSSALMTN